MKQTPFGYTKAAVQWILLLFLLLTFAGCAAAGEPVSQPEQGDVIGTAVAATLAAGEVATETAFAELKATAESLETQTAVAAATAAAAGVTETAVATASMLPMMPTLEPTATAGPPAASPTATQAREPVVVALDELVVAYVGSSRDLWIWRDNQARQLTSTGDVMEVSISGDGEWIAFTRSADFTRYSLWVIRSTGQDERQLMDSVAFEDIPHDSAAITVVPVGIAWVPGSHTLAFSTRPVFEGPGLMLNDDLWLIDVENGQQRELLTAGQGGRFYYSPDGSQIALVQPDTISLVEADGSNLRKDVLTFPEVSTYSGYRYYPVPQWSADSRFLRVVIPPPASLENPEEGTNIWEIQAEGGPAQRLGSVQTAPLAFPYLSPDLSKLAYLAQIGDPDASSMELHIANVDGSADQVYLTEPFLQFSAWAPDSTRFVFTAGEDNRAYLGQIDQASQPLTDSLSALEVRWLDSNRFFFITRLEAGYELHIGAVNQESQPILGGADTVEHFPLYDFTVEE